MGNLPQALISNIKMDPSYKLDEGYSEDTRSQDDLDSPIAMEQYGVLQSHMMSATELSTAVSALTEAEKAGVFIKDGLLAV